MTPIQSVETLELVPAGWLHIFVFEDYPTQELDRRQAARSLAAGVDLPDWSAEESQALDLLIEEGEL
jgi:hypothetical protein